MRSKALKLGHVLQQKTLTARASEGITHLSASDLR